MMDKQDLILQKLDEINERLDSMAITPFIKVKKKKKTESGRRDYTMGYKNSKGEISDRDINVSKVTAKDGKITISAYCFASDAPKAFSANSITYLQPLPDGDKLQTYDDIIAELSAWA